VGGKFLYAGGEKLDVRGVTYGAFRPDENGFEFPAEDVVAGDFGRMAENGVNTVRTYSVPPAWVLDLAQAHGLRLMVGIPWEQHVAFLDERSLARSIEQRVRAAVRASAGHPAILCYVVGNEIPASIVRWHGRRRIERFIERLYRAAKAEDPEALVTYVNYPTTEYLRLPFLDLACFNVYLEEEEQLEVYVARLQYQVGDRPLLLTELGLDSGRHGEDAQAVSVGWQVRTAFRTGCVGAIVFSWTDEWHRSGRDIDDWHFGLTHADRGPKPALAAVREAFEEAPFGDRIHWPSVSVIVCAYNEVRTLEDCLQGIERLDYPEFETIVVDDGSTDSTAEIAERFGVHLISTENRGLSAARNTGIEAATGEIVAFIDADAHPDPHWLRFIAAGLAGTPHGGIGGPNIAPAREGLVSESLQAVPGGPIHVLLSDREAEHVPGCNMAFRREALEEIGGFDPQFRIAGDDVDLCWRLRDAGWMIAFSPGAMVWHRRRGTIRGFLRQQREYGKAEALLERKWPERYNLAGHVRWAGHVYGSALGRIGRRTRIYYGTWGMGLFQRADPLHGGVLAALPVLPEWYLVILALLACALLGFLWTPLLLAVPLFVLAVGALLTHATVAVMRTPFPYTGSSRHAKRRAALAVALYLLQPIGRLSGRLRHGLTPWRVRRGASGIAVPWPRTRAFWSERWQPTDRWLSMLEAGFRSQSSDVRRGGEYDRWDLQVRGGSLGEARLRVGVEEHGDGRQLVRYRIWPRCSSIGFLLVALFSALTAAAVIDQASYAAVAVGALGLTVVLTTVQEAGLAVNACLRAIASQDSEPDGLEDALHDRLMQTEPVAAFAEAPKRSEG
jgi:GT2 family glycosyltransferase